MLGSTLDAISSFKKGNIGMGMINVGLAALDLTGGGAFVKGALVGGFKLSARKALWSAWKNTGSYGSMKRNLVRNGVLTRRTLAEANKKAALTIDHAFIKQRWDLPHALTNAPFNLNPGVPRSVNSALEHMSFIDRASQLPTWFKAGSAATAMSTMVGWGVGSGDE